MTVPTGGLIEVTLNQRFVGIDVANVFYFWNSLNTEPTTFVGLANDFDTKFVPKMAIVQSQSVLYVGITVKTIFGIVPDLTITPTTSAGTVFGEVLNSFSAIPFRYNGATKETRPGSKRLVGVAESHVNGNNFTSAAQAIYDQMAIDFTQSLFSGTTTYAPVIASRPRLSRPNWVVNDLANVVAGLGPTSQVSRK